MKSHIRVFVLCLMILLTVSLLTLPAFAAETEPIVRGDMNGDGNVNIDDAIYLLRHVMMPDKYPITQLGDTDGDDKVNIDDAIYLLRHVMMPEKYPIERCEHVPVTDVAVDATCTETGLTEGSHCDLCGETLVAQETVEELGHNLIKNVCSRCGIEASQGLKFTLNLDGESYSVKGIGTCIDTDLIIPGTYNDLPVTSIGNYAFYYCTSLTNVIIGNNVTSIGIAAFSGCTSLTSVTIPNSVTSIGIATFDCCKSLTSITIPSSVTNIDREAFYYCTSLTSITVDTNNPNYKSIDGNLYNKDGTTLIQYAIGKTDTSFTIPSSVTSIGDNAFFSCKSLTSVTIPNSVTSISNYAFKNCTSLTSVTIPNSVTSIGDGAFSICMSLTSITIPNSVKSIGDGAFDACDSLTSVRFENPEGWWYSSDSAATSGKSISNTDLADPATAAEYLRSTYRDYYWKRS